MADFTNDTANSAAFTNDSMKNDGIPALFGVARFGVSHFGQQEAQTWTNDTPEQTS